MPTTDWGSAEMLEHRIPHTFNSLQKLVMSMVKYQKVRGKKTLFGKDKGRIAWEQLEKELRSTLASMYLDGIIRRSASPDVIREALKDSIESFAECFPNWQDAYAFAYVFLVLEKDNANDVLKALSHT